MYKVSGLCHFLVQAEESLQHAPQVLGGSDHDDLHKNASFHADWHRCYQYTQKEA